MLAGATGYVAIVLLGLVILVLVTPEGGPVGTLLAAYVAPLVVGLAVLALFVTVRTGGGYWDALRRSALAGWTSANLTFAGVFCTLLTLQQTLFPGPYALTSISLWIMLAAAILGGALVAYPFWWWIARRGYDVWIDWLAPEPLAARTLSLREGWVAAAISLVVAVGAVAGAVVGMG